MNRPIDIATRLLHVPAVAPSFPHASADEMERRGVNDRLVRLSVGLEAADDLVRDIDSALQHAGSGA